jgi:hypothetical protein
VRGIYHNHEMGPLNQDQSCALIICDSRNKRRSHLREYYLAFLAPAPAGEDRPQTWMLTALCENSVGVLLRREIAVGDAQPQQHRPDTFQGSRGVRWIGHGLQL